MRRGEGLWDRKGPGVKDGEGKERHRREAGSVRERGRYLRKGVGVVRGRQGKIIENGARVSDGEGSGRREENGAGNKGRRGARASGAVGGEGDDWKS